MATTLGGITFATKEIQHIDRNKNGGLLEYGIPFNDSEAAEVFSWGGNIKRFTISGTISDTSEANVATRINAIEALMTAQQSSIAFSDAKFASPAVYVKVLDVKFGADVQAAPLNLASFTIELIQAAQD